MAGKDPPTAAADEVDDYMSMTFDDAASKPAKETSLQRTARLKREAAERGRVPSKAERREQEKAARERALATRLEASNKGAQMMARMGFQGGALGRTEGARTQPVELLVKEDRGGVGMDAEKKRKVREAAEGMEGAEKRRKADEGEFLVRTKNGREERRVEGTVWSAMKTLEELESENTVPSEYGRLGFEDVSFGEHDAADKETAPSEPEHPDHKPLRSINILYRALIKQRRSKERDRRIRYDIHQSLSKRTDFNDPDADPHDKLAWATEVVELEEEDSELNEFEALPGAERLAMILNMLRVKYHYCFWCKFRYPDSGMDGCPGLTEDEHE